MNSANSPLTEMRLSAGVLPGHWLGDLPAGQLGPGRVPSPFIQPQQLGVSVDARDMAVWILYRNSIPGRPDDQPDAASSAAPRHKILVVEDETIVALDLSHTLRKLGYIVTGDAASGENAIQLALETQPDVVLMDIQLQGKMNGIEAAEQIRVHLGIPVIFLTAFVDDTTVQRAKMAGPAAFLRKPYIKADLQAAIEAAIAGD